MFSNDSPYACHVIMTGYSSKISLFAENYIKIDIYAPSICLDKIFFDQDKRLLKSTYFVVKWMENDFLATDKFFSQLNSNFLSFSQAQMNFLSRAKNILSGQMDGALV